MVSSEIDKLPPAVEAALLHVERGLEGLSGAIISGDCAQLDLASTDLRRLAAAFSSLMEAEFRTGGANRRLHSRVKVLGLRLVFQRENLLRRLTSVERTLHALVPATRQATYAPASGPYGAGARRSGAFSHLAA